MDERGRDTFRRPERVKQNGGARRPARVSDRREATLLPKRAAGDPETLVAIDSPDDVDLYRHPGPPPGFDRASPARFPVWPDGCESGPGPGKRDRDPKR